MNISPMKSYQLRSQLILKLKHYWK